ncbi:MAG: C10 family peptidase, partial [Desulfamplus sp.]|nr:C10 family peptidase [Desulfamplus sp.]
MNNKHNLSLNEFMLIYFMKIKSIKLGIFAATITLATLIFIQPIFAVEVPLITAEKVALNFITYLGEDNYTISSTEPLEESGEIIGYLVNLTPQGYILIAGDTIRVPIKAYSLTSNFDNLPPSYVKVLLNELKVEESLKKSASGKNSGRNQPEEINSSYWEFLTQTKIVSRKSLRNYTPDTYLLTTKWDQGYPYNKFNPKVGEELTVTGCVQTALAQVMRYHKYPSKGSGVFKHTWGGKILTAVMNRPFNWDSMPDRLDGNTPQYQQDEVAALMRDLGVLNEAAFGTDSVGGTSVSFGDGNTNKFRKAFSYSNILYMDNRDNLFFTTIKNEIDNKRPIILAIPGHMAVADGYASDGSGKKIHVNFGWAGSNDDYYYLDKTINTTQNSFSPQNTIFYNIKPCENYECDPYITTTSGNSPVIGSYQNGSLISAPSDIVINSNNGSAIIRVEAYDPDGDTVTLSALSSCSNLKTNIVDNILTLTP